MELRKLTLILLACCCVSSVYAQQISINDSFSEVELIENNLIQGCVETSNIQSQVNGEVNGFKSFAFFEKANSGFPFENGIMLSTGSSVSGGNSLNTAVLNEGQTDWGTDPDLESALGISGTLNATSIEFDFISVTNQIQFNYILASEEYFGDFPCAYSDGFAFLIKEAGTDAPYVNIATIPDTTIPVNTNTIHDEIVGFCSASNEQYFEGYNVGDTNYNGRTKVMTANAEILPNVQYHIKLVIADQNDRNYDSAVFIQGNSFNSSVDLGEDIQTCANLVTLNGNIDNPDATYSWYLNDTPITGATQAQLDVTQTGSYRVEIEIPLAGSSCIIEDTVMVTLSSEQSADPIPDYELCDDASADEIESFDLSTKDSDVLATVPPSNYAISYHFTSGAAQNGTAGVSGTMLNLSNPQTIYVRIEDTINGCLAFQNFDLIVNPTPTITDPTPLLVCDDNVADGFTTIDLSQKDDEITNGNFDLSVSYHLNQNDATFGSNSIPLPYVNTNVNETLFVHVVNVLTGCTTSTTLDIEVLNNPVISNEIIYIDACDVDLDGVAIFDMTSIVDDILNGTTNVNVTYHETQGDADIGLNPIVDPTNYTNINAEEQTIFIRIEDADTGCASITSIGIHTNLLLTATNIRDYTACDENNDGIELFDFNEIEEFFIDDLDLIMDYDINIEFYESETDRDNGVNALDKGASFLPSSNPQTIYITLTSPTCQEVAQFNLLINPVVEFEPISDQTFCDTDQDGLTTIDLAEYDDMVTNGQTEDFTVRYFISEEDADENTNILPSLYTNVTNPLTIYARITSNETSCADINAFNIEVLPAPLSSAPTGIVICDDDQDGISNIDLNAKISEVVDNTANRAVTFYNSQNDANNANNPITSLFSYPASTETIFIRIENTITGCFNTERFDVIVNTLPVINPIVVYKFCELGDDGFGEFVFSTQDADILSGQEGKQVFYYETASNANSNTDPIDKDEIYVNTSNPQTIYFRIENITDANCYTTSSFPIEVGTNPAFNEPTDIFICDDISNDGSVNFDFNIQIAEVSEGISDIQDISFHASRNDAENNENPLPLDFNNTVNPQQIYVRINNGSICESYTSFVLNIIAAPSVNPSQSLTQCDENYDGIVTFDLTLSELDILDERQDNIQISYFVSEDDAFLDNNKIADPTNYTNLSNPQTVFVRIANTISDCFVVVPLDLFVNLPPGINPIAAFDTCENETNSVDLTNINPLLLQQTANVIVRYFASEEDARNINDTLDTDYTYLTSSDVIYARVEFTTTGCFYIHPLTLRINSSPIANQPNDLEACDDDFDGFLSFNITQQNATILGGQNPNIFSVSYYLDDILAEEGIQPLPTNYEAMDNETIYARVQNNSTECYALTEFSIRVFERPVVNIEDQVICLDNLPLVVSANTNNAGDSYLWSNNATTPEIEITAIGTYSVTVTTPNGCETTRVFPVIESESAFIEITETIDFSDPNNITVTVSGIGNYLYQLDDEDPQQSNVFENVSLGYHTITIIDLNGCSEVSKEIVVIDAPKFFTPNDDSYFDTWHITGVETLTGTVVYIYDRYGKLLTALDSNDKGWNGYYNGNLMPASDYWFVANVKKNNIEFQVKGHFALRL
ncbi:choice-of-anchor L domain-containing protein [Psychroserpens sp.]|uniref:choice-of-anchor L domain-containing protein n=1 Tax=Psychroserpens sp. TaxID=2020870 RepID=UPI003C74D0A1